MAAVGLCMNNIIRFVCTVELFNNVYGPNILLGLIKDFSEGTDSAGKRVRDCFFVRILLTARTARWRRTHSARLIELGSRGWLEAGWRNTPQSLMATEDMWKRRRALGLRDGACEITGTYVLYAGGGQPRSTDPTGLILWPVFQVTYRVM